MDTPNDALTDRVKYLHSIISDLQNSGFASGKLDVARISLNSINTKKNWKDKLYLLTRAAELIGQSRTHAGVA